MNVVEKGYPFVWNWVSVSAASKGGEKDCQKAVMKVGMMVVRMEQPMAVRLVDMMAELTAVYLDLR